MTHWRFVFVEARIENESFASGVAASDKRTLLRDLLRCFLLECQELGRLFALSFGRNDAKTSIMAL